jgi:hypothetical protein
VPQNYHMFGSWNSSVGDRAMGLMTEDSGFGFGQRQETFLFSTSVLALEPIQPHIQLVPGLFHQV